MNRFNIGKRIEAYRDRRKMSTQELAARIKRSQATISRIENGKQGVTFELLASIAEELGIHPFALLSDETPPGLASLQRFFFHIHHMIKERRAGEEERILNRIETLLDSVDADFPAEPESSPDEVGLFLDKLSRHLVNALQDTDFRGKMFRMAGVAPVGDARELVQK